MQRLTGLLQGFVCGTVCRYACSRSLASDSLGDILKIIYLGFEKSQRSVTHGFLRYINILTNLPVLTYMISADIVHCAITELLVTFISVCCEYSCV